MVVYSDLAKTTSRSAYAVTLIMIFVVLCISSFSSGTETRAQLRQDIYDLSRFTPGVLSRRQAFQERVPFASCILAEHLFDWNSNDFPEWQNLSLAYRLNRSGLLDLEFSFNGYDRDGQCGVRLTRQPDWDNFSSSSLIENLMAIIDALDAVNSDALFDSSMTAEALGRNYALALHGLGMATDPEGDEYIIRAETILNMVRRHQTHEASVANWIVFETKPLSGGSIGGASDFELIDHQEIGREIDKFIFDQEILSLFFVRYPDLPQEEAIRSVVNTNLRPMLEPSEFSSSLRLPFLGVGIPYQSFLMVSGVALVFFFAMFGTVQQEFRRYQIARLVRDRIVVFPQLTSPSNPLELNRSVGSANMARLVWGSFLVAPLAILAFATLFRYDPSGVGRVANSGAHFFTPYQRWQATAFDLINLVSFFVAMLIVRALLRDEIVREPISQKGTYAVLVFFNIVAAASILSVPLVGAYNRIFLWNDTYAWNSLLTSPRFYVYSIYLTIGLAFCTGRVSGDASRFFIVAMLAINGIIGFSLNFDFSP